MKRLLILCTLLLSSSRFAEPATTYLNLNLLYGGLQTPNEDYADECYSTCTTSHKIGGLGFGINAGYLFDSYQFSLPYEWRLGAEAGYNQFADNTYTYDLSYRGDNPDDIKYSSYALSFLGVIRYQNDTNWLAFFKAGVARVIQNLTFSTDYDHAPSKADFSPQFVIGGGYQLSNHIDANASYNYIMGTAPTLGSNNSVAPASYFAFTLGYSF
jgi:hypothetical protein